MLLILIVQVDDSFRAVSFSRCGLSQVAVSVPENAKVVVTVPRWPILTLIAARVIIGTELETPAMVESTFDQVYLVGGAAHRRVFLWRSKVRFRVISCTLHMINETCLHR